MISNNENIQGMLNNILEKVEVIKKDFNSYGETHFAYILEKLNSAKWDLDALIKMANDKSEEVK